MGRWPFSRLWFCGSLLGLCLLLIPLPLCAGERAPDLAEAAAMREEMNRDLAAFQGEIGQEVGAFRDERDRDFAEFLQEQWQAFQEFDGLVAKLGPKPKVIPKAADTPDDGAVPRRGPLVTPAPIPAPAPAPRPARFAILNPVRLRPPCRLPLPSR